MPDYTIRVFKAWNSSLIERAWSNTYELASSAEDVGGLMTAAQRIVDAEQNIHLTAVHFLQYTISTWTPDSHPYDPETFVTVGLNIVGNRAMLPSIDAALDYNVCAVVKRQPQTGKVGRLYYRGCLLENDVQMGGDGRWVFSPDYTDSFADRFVDYMSSFGPLLGLAPIATHLEMVGTVKGAPGVITRRNVVDLKIGGVTVNKRNHRYFDRAP